MSVGVEVAPLEGLLRELLVEVRELRLALVAHRGELAPRRSPTLTRDDRAHLARMLPAIAGAVGADFFASRDLVAHDSAAVRLVVSSFTPKKLGRLLLRAEGVPIDGLVVQRAGAELGVVLWKIAAC